MSIDVGKLMYERAKDLFPINRSLTGEGTRTTLNYIKKILPEMKLFEVESGTPAFDWTVPDEWNVSEAWIKGPDGKIVLDFKKNNLHLLGYSEPIHKKLSLSELQSHLYSLPDQPDAIPYVTSYYKRRWGFCLSEQQRKGLADGEYEVLIDSKLEPGHLTYGEVILPGKSEEEILLSTYVCHPSMGNNELSGPVVTSAIAEWLKEQKERRYTYRIIFIPETIGSLVYLSRNFKEMKERIIAGFVLTCIGDDKAYSMLESRKADTLADKVAKHVLKYHAPDFLTYSFLKRGSDERQYCSPGIDLPVCDLMRSKYGEYPEYHTSLDNLDFISPEGLEGGYQVVKKCLTLLENNHYYKTTVLGEPQLGKRGLYPTVSTKGVNQVVRDMMNVIAYSDGTMDLLDIAAKIEVNAFDVLETTRKLCENDVLQKV